MPKTINVDLDGVLYNFAHAMKVQLGRPDLPPSDRWEVWEAWGLTHEEWIEAFERGVTVGHVFRGSSNGIADLRAIGAISAISANHRIRIVTSRDGRTPALATVIRHRTVAWLLEADVPHDELVFASAKHAFPADVVIDDNPDCRTWAQPGALNILYAQPWNERGVLVPWGAAVHRTSNWDEIGEAIGRG